MAAAFVPLPRRLRSTVCKNCVYGTVLDDTEVTVMMKRPDVSASGSGVLAPFDVEVWMLILVSVILVGPIMYLLIILRCVTWDLSNNKSEKGKSNTQTWTVLFKYNCLL